MIVRPQHFSRKAVRWEDLKSVLRGPIQGAFGGQGTVFALDDSFEGVVAKLYHDPRSARHLQRVRGLIALCGAADEEKLATRIFLERLNLPLRPVVRGGTGFVGVLLPPLPESIHVDEYRFDPDARELVASSERIKFSAQYLLQDESSIGYANEAWRWRVAYSLVETVATMHAANLVHGDLSLDNTLVQKLDDSGLRDTVYLIDLDDAFNVAPGRPTPTEVRKSRNLHDPDSVRAGRVSKETDVFVLALWVVSLIGGRVVRAPAFVRDRQIPTRTRQLISQRSPRLLDRIQRALGSLENGRPTASALLEVMPVVGERYTVMTRPGGLS